MRTILLITTLLSLVQALTAASAPVTILATGELHGQLDSCGCPTNPVGGLTRVSTLVGDRRSDGPVLLLDAGGFAAGGIYDVATEGRQPDSVRTLSMVTAMSRMQYDAVAIGDEELGFGMRRMAWIADDEKLPIVCANAFYENGHYVTQPYRIVKRGGTAFGIAGLVTADRLFDVDPTVTIEDPAAALARILPKLVDKCDFPVVLSHLGEEKTRALAVQFPQVRLWVNGHRKVDAAAGVSLGSAQIMQFGFQGKTVSTASLSKAGRERTLSSSSWIPINDSIAPDRNLTTLSERYAVYRRGFTRSFDLYIMSECPYGLPALSELVQLANRAGKVALSVWFIGDVVPDSLGGDSLHSLHGAPEVLDEMRWLAVQALYPGLWMEFLQLRSVYGLPTMGAISELSLDTARINEWVVRQGASALAGHYRRSERLDIQASPTLYVNNAPYDHEDIRLTRFAKEFCKEGRAPKELCDSLPECIEDGDCSRAGYIGLCGETGSCSYLRDAAFDFRIIIPDTSLRHSETSAIETTRRLFPAAQIRIMRSSDPTADSLLRRYEPASLPLYLIDSTIRQTHRFTEVEKGVAAFDGPWLTFKPGIMKPSFFYRREAKPGNVELFVDPLSRAWSEAFSVIRAHDSALSKIRIWPLASLAGDSATDSVSLHRLSVARIWLSCAIYYPGIYAAFLDSVVADPTPERRAAFLVPRGIDPAAFDAGTAKIDEYMGGLVALERSFDRREPVLVLIGNRELIAVSGRAELQELLR